MAQMDKARMAEMIEACGEVEDHEVERDGDRNVSFRGWRLGSWGDDTGVGTTTRVTIYLTTGGRHIIHEHGGAQWDGCSDTDVVRITTSPGDVLQALRDMCGGEYLGRISKAAYSQACESDPALAAVRVETIA